MKFDIFQMRFKKVDNTNGWPEGCTDKWNQLKVNKTELETFFQKLGVFQTAQHGFNKLFGNQLKKKSLSNVSAISFV